MTNNPKTEIKPEDKTNKSIFSMSFGQDKRDKTEIKKNNIRKGTIYTSIAALLLGVYSFVFLYPQLAKFLAFQKEMSDFTKQAEEYDITLAELEKTRVTHKAAYDEEFKEELKVIDQVFPLTPEKLEVVRLMENFATRLDTAYPPFEFTSISFQAPEKKEGYTVLPFQTSIHASQNNFDRFLGLIDLSGNTDPKNPDHIRLMEISNITLNYRGPDATGKDQGVDFNVQLKAYSR